MGLIGFMWHVFLIKTFILFVYLNFDNIHNINTLNKVGVNDFLFWFFSSTKLKLKTTYQVLCFTDDNFATH